MLTFILHVETELDKIMKPEMIQILITETAALLIDYQLKTPMFAMEVPVQPRTNAKNESLDMSQIIQRRNVKNPKEAN